NSGLDTSLWSMTFQTLGAMVDEMTKMSGHRWICTGKTVSCTDCRPNKAERPCTLNISKTGGWHVTSFQSWSVTTKTRQYQQRTYGYGGSYKTISTTTKHLADSHAECCEPTDTVASIQIQGVSRSEPGLKPVRPVLALSPTEVCYYKIVLISLQSTTVGTRTLASGVSLFPLYRSWQLLYPVHPINESGTLLGEAPLVLRDGGVSVVRCGSVAYISAVESEGARRYSLARETEDEPLVSFLSYALDVDYPEYQGEEDEGETEGEGEAREREREAGEPESVDEQEESAQTLLEYDTETGEWSDVPLPPALSGVTVPPPQKKEVPPKPEYDPIYKQYEYPRPEEGPTPRASLQCHKVLSAVVAETAYIFMFEQNRLAHILTYSVREGWGDRTEEGVGGMGLWELGTASVGAPWVLGQYVVFPRTYTVRVSFRRRRTEKKQTPEPLTVYDTITGRWTTDVLEATSVLMVCYCSI
ncbi:hypothetical protein KIPB_007334, partial [Kipferlia bialata]